MTCVTEGCGCHSPAHTWFVVFRTVLSVGRYLLFQDFLSQRDSQGCKWRVGHSRALISCPCSLWVIIRLLRIKIETSDVQKCSCQWSTKGILQWNCGTSPCLGRKLGGLVASRGVGTGMNPHPSSVSFEGTCRNS